MAGNSDPHPRTIGVLRGNLAGVRFRFECDSDELERYAGLHLGTLRTDDAADAPCDVDVRLRWRDGPPPARRELEDHLAGFERRDRDLYIDGHRLRWFRVDDLRDLHLAAERDGETLRVEADFYFRVGNSGRSDRIRRLLQPGTTRYRRRRRFTTLLYYLVYYPCWFVLERDRGYHPIHAGAVETENGVVLLAGASGVGKSTLSVALAARAGNRFLSDSFVVHRGADVLAVREPILLDPAAVARIGPPIDGLVELPWDYVLDRSGYRFAPERLANGGRASLLVFPYRAPEPFVRALSPGAAHARLSAGDMMINDLRRYWGFSAVFEQIGDAGLMLHREQALAELTQTVPAYELGLAAAAKLDDAVAAITDLPRDSG